jgi:outer membrane protein OmpA-like peptidoglycan-associated protein
MSNGGVSGDVPARPAEPVLVGPATDGQINTVMPALIPVACFRVDDLRFEFDSSIVRPELSDHLKELDALLKKHPGAPLSVFGHADPTGSDDYNKQLSGRRSQAIYALLTRKVDLWEDLFKNTFGGDNWGTKSLQIMLKKLGHYSGPLNGVLDAPTKAAVKQFQLSPEGAGVNPDSDPGPNTRRQLFRAYMDRVCIDAAGAPFQLDPEHDFLARGADAKGKGDFQGCSEFNPVLMFSKDENVELNKPGKKADRDAENAPNRRVMILLFRPGSRVAPARWPCPRVKEGIAGCKRRFFSDASVRRQFQAAHREFPDTHDTFACRFYQRISENSPCEGLGPVAVLTSFVLIVDEIGLPVKDTTVKVRFADGRVVTFFTDQQGRIDPVLAPGETFSVEVADIQEGRPGASTTTPSGQHFAANGTGP